MNSYGSLSLTESSPAQTFDEPLTLAEVKKFLELPERSPADAEEDAQLELFISASREIAEGAQNRDLVVKQYDLALDYFRDYEIELRDPLVSVDLIRYRDSAGDYTSLVEDADYIVDTSKHPGIVLPPYAQSWPSFTPWPSSAVLVRFTSGYSASHPFWSDAGKRIKTGMLHLISGWFNNRIPFEPGTRDGMNEYPWSVTMNLTMGRLERVR